LNNKCEHACKDGFIKNTTGCFRCPEYQDANMENNICTDKCINKDKPFYNTKTKQCDQCNKNEFWLQKKNKMCVSRCSKLQSYDRYRDRCIDIYKLFDESAEFLSTQNTNG